MTSGMRVVEAPGGTISMGTRPRPHPGPTDLLVKVAAAGLNGADLLQAAGGYPPPAGAPDTLGLEFSGHVTHTGADCQGFRPGDRVMGLVQGGAQADYVVIHERLATARPQLH